MSLHNARKIICAVDTADLKTALDLSARLGGVVGALKLGLEFFTANGPAGVREIAEMGAKIFLDLKFHDIPNTVAQAVKSAAELGVFMLTVHTAGGSKMLRAAGENAGETLLLGVTVLTSFDEADLNETGIPGGTSAQVLKMAKLAAASGLRGAVCSGHEAAEIKRLGLVTVVPGIRPEWAEKQDQKRVMTPAEAVAAGADYMVIGRPITRHPNPLEAVGMIAEEINGL